MVTDGTLTWYDAMPIRVYRTACTHNSSPQHTGTEHTTLLDTRSDFYANVQQTSLTHTGPKNHPGGLSAGLSRVGYLRAGG